MTTRSSSAPSRQGGAACVSGWKWARRGGGLTDVEDFVCSQLSGQHCLRPWLVVGRAKICCHRGLRLPSAASAALLVSLAGSGWGQTDVQAFFCSRRAGRPCWSHWLVVSGAGGQADAEVFVCSQRSGRNSLCPRLAVCEARGQAGGVRGDLLGACALWRQQHDKGEPGGSLAICLSRFQGFWG